MDFIPGRQQDASPTIRGFWFQIQLTLLRWLDLPQGEVLYLECGEDIDRVLRTGADEKLQRELEQVKVRERRITLQSAEALEALANFAAHLKANPGIVLRFRFTTTTLPGRERMSLIGHGTAAIEIWKALQEKTVWTPDDEALLNKLAEMISRSRRPKRCSSDAWEALVELSRGTGTIRFREFLSRFEWSFGTARPEKLRALVVERLAAFPGSTSPEDPVREQRYEHLVSALLAILSRSGTKQLTKRDLNEALLRPTLTEHDRARIKTLEDRSALYATKLTSIEDAVHQLDLSHSVPIVFGKASGDLKPVDPALVLPDPAPIVARLSRRQDTVNTLCNELTSLSWLALYGSVGIGKSHLGSLLAETKGGILFGISMRGIAETDAERALQGILSSIGNLKALDHPGQGIMLLDDVPDYEPRSRLEALLVTLIKHFSNKGHTIISTSRRAPPTTTNYIYGGTFCAREAPPFSEADVIELFLAHGIASDFLTPERVRTMNAACSGHPILLTAIARYFAERKTTPEQAFMDALFARKHRERVDLETARSVLSTIEAQECRSLLYRLAAANLPLRCEEIRQVAAVEPPLPDPTACIARLDGLWLRRTSASQYEVSPLVTPLGQELPPTVNRSLHKSLANIIFSRVHLSTIEFIRAILSLIIAEEPALAAMHLLHGCMTWPQKADGYKELGILLFFPLNKDYKLPPRVELPLRAAQAVTAAIGRQDFAPYVNRIEEAIKNVTSEAAVGAMLSGSMILVSSLQIPTSLAIFGASLIERFRDTSSLPQDLIPRIPHHADLHHLLLVTASIRTWDDLDGFVEMLAGLPESRRQKLNELPQFREYTQVIVFRPLFDSQAQLTQGAFERLGNIFNRCLEVGLLRLAAYAAAGRLVVIGEFKKDADRLLEEAEHSKSLLTQDDAAVAIINSTLGQQLLLNKRTAEGLRLLNVSLSNPQHIIGLERGNRLVDGLNAAWDAGQDPSAYTDELATLLDTDEFSVSEALCQMHAQIAVVRWRQGRRNDSFLHFEQAVIRFFDLEDRVRTRQLGTGLGHAIAYCASIAETGSPPQSTPNGEPFVEACPGMFSGVNEGMAQLWKARQSPALLRLMLAQLAGALGHIDAASNWMDRALEAAIQQKVPLVLVMLGPRAVMVSLRGCEWENAVEAAVTFGRAQVFVDQKRLEGSAMIEDFDSFEPLEAPLEAQQRSQAEQLSLFLLSRALVAEMGGRLPMESSLGEELAGVIEAFALSAEIAAAWRAFAMVVRLWTSPSVTIQQHKTALEETSDVGSDNARFAAHGLLSFRSDAELKQSVLSQALILHRLGQLKSKFLEFSLSGYAEAICRHWAETVSREAFRFCAPRQLCEEIESFRGMAALSRAKMILRTVMTALSVPVPSDVVEWMAATDDRGGLASDNVQQEI